MMRKLKPEENDLRPYVVDMYINLGQEYKTEIEK